MILSDRHCIKSLPREGLRHRLAGNLSSCEKFGQQACSLVDLMAASLTPGRTIFTKRLVRSSVWIFPWLFLGCWLAAMVPASAAETSAAPDQSVAAGTNNGAASSFRVTTYVVQGSTLLSTNILVPLLSQYTGPDVSLDQIVKAATELHEAYRKAGYPMMSVAIPRDQITNGVVTLNVFETALPQIVVSGVRYASFTNGWQAPPVQLAGSPTPAPVATNVPPPRSLLRSTPATAEELAEARAALLEKMAAVEAAAKNTRIQVVAPTNGEPRFDVERYDITGNTVLTPNDVAEALTNIDGAFGTNVTFEGVQTVVEQLHKTYYEHGYVTVAVDVPQQKLTNASVKLQVLEGRLADIKVAGNHYFSSNNVMRALPSLHSGMVLNGPVFNAELSRANANQDRQIYPVIGPGPTPGTSDLTLNVQDRLPLHAKLEFNNQNSPGTPDLRVNGSAVYDNLWQAENALGVDYGFSPQNYKLGDQWNFYDQPLVAYYSAFYRLPLGSPEPIANAVENNPDNFGYNEATRQFNLPPPSNQPELTFYGNRATIDTGVQVPSYITLATNLTEETTHQDLTINEGMGFQLDKPLPQMDGVSSSLSGGLDFKFYNLTSYGTNIFRSTSSVTNNNIVYTTTNTVVTQIPTTDSTLDYLPLSLAYNASFQDAFGPATFGLNFSANLWYSSDYSTTETETETNATGTNRIPVELSHLTGRDALQYITGSTKSSGHWVILKPSFSQQIQFYTNWITNIRLDGQWASEPLVSIEQFGAGGVNSVRGYHEGEVFGDDGYHLSLEQDTPAYTVGMIHDGTPLTLSGSVYMDYARVYLIDPEGRPGSTALWGTGFGFSASAGPHWQAQFLFSWPLLSTPNTPAYQPFFNFALTSQF